MADSSIQNILLQRFQQFGAELTDGQHGLTPVPPQDDAGGPAASDQYLWLRSTETGKTEPVPLRSWCAHMMSVIRNTMARLSTRASLGALLCAYAQQLTQVYNDQNVNPISPGILPDYPPNDLAQNPCASNYGIYLTGMLLADPYLSDPASTKPDAMYKMAARRMARNQSQQVLRLPLPAESWLPDYCFPLAALRYVDPATYPYTGKEQATDRLTPEDRGADGLLMKPYPYLDRDKNGMTVLHNARWHCNHFVCEALFCTLLYYYRVSSDTPIAAFSFEDPSVLQAYRQDALAVHNRMLAAGLISASHHRYRETTSLYERLRKLQQQSGRFLPNGTVPYYAPGDTQKNAAGERKFDAAYLQHLRGDLGTQLPRDGSLFQPEDTMYLVFFGHKQCDGIPSHVEIVTSLRLYTLDLPAASANTTLLEFTSIGSHKSHAYPSTYSLCCGSYTRSLPAHDHKGNTLSDAPMQSYALSGLYLRKKTATGTAVYDLDLARFVRLSPSGIDAILGQTPRP